jgi:uncharacterized protein
MTSNRRAILKATCATLGFSGIPTLSTPSPASSQQAERDSFGLPAEWRKMRKIDMHNHIVDPVNRPDVKWERVEGMIEAAQVLGIETLCCSRPITGGKLAEIAEVREANDAVLAAMRRYPKQIAGFCFAQPGNGQAQDCRPYRFPHRREMHPGAHPFTESLR